MKRGIDVEKVKYGGWPNCYRLSNGLVDLVLTTDVGPRIIRFGFVGQGNEFKEYEEMLGQSGGLEWRIYGGHRLWHGPEVIPRTYHPDNYPVSLEQHDQFVRLVQTTETTTGIQKEIDLLLSPDAARVQVTHRLRNRGPWAVELAPWALSVMACGGVAVVPLPPRGPHPQFLLPSSTITLWAYSDMSDPRWTWGHKYILLRQDTQATTPQKAGYVVPDGWVAYARAGHLFVITFDYVQGARYPDLGSCVETWTDPDMLELETLGPLALLGPGAAVEHIERWSLFRGMPVPMNDAHVQEHVLPNVRAAQE